MWSIPSTIPGKPTKPIHLPNDKLCPHCHLTYRKVIQKAEKGSKVTYRCPHCDNIVNIKIPK